MHLLLHVNLADIFTSGNQRGFSSPTTIRHSLHQRITTVMIISPEEGLRSLPRRSLYQPSSWLT
ncbi:hypothetical protein Bca52824_043681 [Brassica carinata]|uniref:Uncharacterized protein n=1 Tax=Brassica carinata TaxID=52824 RepID=A0A8X7RZQ8_BRACI|nr:hypothetical protein Bca52824_043681 [Brassica carinata]